MLTWMLSMLVSNAIAADLFDGLPLTTLQGAPLDAASLDGQVVLVVNVASRCGFTRQYAGLQALYAELADQGLVVLGVPCNQFGQQEPGTAAEIQTFCQTSYGVTFPMLEKQAVNGSERSPLYARLIGDGPDVAWNFEKFLVGRDGAVIDRYSSRVAPDDPRLRAAIAEALAATP